MKSPSRRRFIKIAATAMALPGTAGLAATSSRRSTAPHPISWRGIALGAETSIILYGKDRTQGGRLMEICIAQLRRLESLFTLYDERSQLCRLNKRGSLENPAAEFVDLLRQAQAISELTEGVFDITIQPQLDALAAEEGSKTIPLAARSAVGYRNLAIEPQAVRFLRPQMAITLNGIAQGYITEYIAHTLRQEGLAHALVEIGEKQAIGTHPSGRPWSIGIESPVPPHRISTLAPLDSQAIATSGRYRADLPRTHLARPHADTPQPDRFSSLSVIASSATLADGLSTAFFLMEEAEISGALRRLDQPIQVISLDPQGTPTRLA